LAIYPRRAFDRAQIHHGIRQHRSWGVVSEHSENGSIGNDRD